MGTHTAHHSPKPKGGDPLGQQERVEIREVLNSFRRIVRCLRIASRRAEQQVGLSGAQLFVLQCLSRQNPCSVKELAVRTATDQSSVSVVVSRLVALGHVHRAPSKEDRRITALSLTRTGQKLIEAAPDVPQSRLILALAGLPVGDLQALARILSQVVRAAEVAHLAPALFFEDHPQLDSLTPSAVSERGHDGG